VLEAVQVDNFFETRPIRGSFTVILLANDEAEVETIMPDTKNNFPAIGSYNIHT
jgi:hypothetical protein